MSWQIVVLSLGVLFIGCAFAAVHRWLNTFEGRLNDQATARLNRLEEEMRKLTVAITSGPVALRKAGY